jgi:O-antigen/teichoic acid export membrane protein
MVMANSERHVLSHVGIYLLARGLPGVVAFLAIPLFSRLLHPAEYGRYALVVAAAGLVNSLLFQWTRLALVRYLPAHRGESARALKSVLATAVVALSAVLGVAAAAAWWALDGSRWRAAVWPCWALLSVQAGYELCCEFARASVRPWQYMAMQLARSAVGVALGAALAVAVGWWGPVVGLAAGMGLAVAYAAARDWRDVRPSLDRATLAKVGGYGVPISLTVALTVVIGTSDRFLIDRFLGDGAAGLYSVAFDFTCQTLTLLMLVVNLAVFPLAVRAWESEGPEAAKGRMAANAALLVAVGAPCLVGMCLLAPGIARAFLGAQFRDAAVGLIPLVAAGTFLAGLKAYHFDAAFQFAHRTIHQVWIVLVAAVLNVGLNVLLIPAWGLHGAAAASAVAFGVAIGLTVWQGRRHVALPFPAKPCAQVLAACAAMGAAVYPLRGFQSPAAFAGQVVLGAAVYGVALVAVDFLGLRGAVARRWRGRAGTVRQAAGVSAASPQLAEVS